MEVEVAKIWLIKSSSYILGPYSLEEVIQLLTSKHLSLIDEIRSPESRWTFIREHKMLSHVVQFIRDQETLSKEDTGSTQVIKISPPPPSIPKSPLVHQGPENQAKDVTSEELPKYDSQSAYSESQMDFTQESDSNKLLKSRPNFYPQISKEISTPQKSRQRWIPLIAGAGLGVLGVIGFFIYRYQMNPAILSPPAPIKKVEVNPSDIFLRYEKAFENREFERAYNELLAYEKLQALKPREVLRKFQIVSLVMNQTGTASQMLSSFDLSALDEEMKLEFQNLLGLIKLQESQFSDAKKIFSDLEKQDSTYEPAQINYMTALLAEGSFSEVNDEFRKLMLAGVKEPSIFILRAMATLQSNAEKSKLQSVIQDLNKFMGRYADYQSEALLLLSALQARIGMYRDANSTVGKLVKYDPDSTKKHFSTFSISRRMSQWSVLAPICDSTVKLIQDGISQKLLEGYCKYQLDDLQGALTVFEKGRIQYNREPAFLGLQAFILFKTKRSSELDAFITANSTANSELFHLVYGWNSLNKGDLTGAAREFKAVLNEIPQNLAALAGMAEIELLSKNKAKASSYISQLQTISENYLPLQTLRVQIDAL